MLSEYKGCRVEIVQDGNFFYPICTIDSLPFIFEGQWNSEDEALEVAKGWIDALLSD